MEVRKLQLRNLARRAYGEIAPGGATREQLVAEVKAIVRPVLKYRKYLEKAKYAGTPIMSREEGNRYLHDLAGPAAVGRFGASELGGLVHYLAHRDAHGYCASWGRHRTMLYRNAGVYPPEPAIFSRFAEVFLDALGKLDVLGVWYRPGEAAVRRQFAPRARLMEVSAFEPYYDANPWTRRLAGKRVLVVSPFAQTIQQQYARRAEIWRAKPDVLPEFQLRTIRVPLSAALTPPSHPDWFSSLDDMRRRMEAEPFDFAFVGAGAWSLLLAVHAKLIGGCGVQLGGPTQILFGVRGRRWDANDGITPYFNEAWVRPSKDETPTTVRQVENGCYW